MQAGQLDRFVLIEEEVEGAQGATGEIATTWRTLFSLWARVTPTAGNERFTSSQHLAQADTAFRVRWVEGVTPLNRISYDAHLYDIVAVMEVGRREGLDILARARPEREDEEAVGT